MLHARISIVTDPPLTSIGRLALQERLDEIGMTMYDVLQDGHE